MRKIGDFEIVDHGILDSVGCENGSFHHVATGFGVDMAEATRDCIVQMRMIDFNIEDIEARILKQMGWDAFPIEPWVDVWDNRRFKDHCTDFYHISIRWNEMILKSPVILTNRLLPGVKIGDATISIEYANWPGDNGRTRYTWYIDDAAEENYEYDDLQCPPGSILQNGLESLINSLSLFAQAYPNSENAHFFPDQLVDWASKNSYEIAKLQCILQEKEMIKE